MDKINGNYSVENRVFKLGAIAAANKKVVGDNPYHEKDNDHWKWLSGFSYILSQRKTSD